MGARKVQVLPTLTPRSFSTAARLGVAISFILLTTRNLMIAMEGKRPALQEARDVVVELSALPLQFIRRSDE